MGERILDVVAAHPSLGGVLLLGACACVEYLFPPFPGDLVTVFGAFLVARRGWPKLPVFSSVMLGSMVGFMLDYYAGRLFGRSEARWSGRLARMRPTLDGLIARFERHGALYLILNRFVPSVRAFFFIAAGLARLSPWRVLAFGALSAALWNLLLFALGLTVGHNWDRLRTIAETYGLVATLLVGLVATVAIIRWRLRARS
jgi:membrane protein DedA with SNARE-associated domain